MTSRHDHLCPDCWTWHACRGEHCADLLTERCVNCQPQPSRPERESIGLTEEGRSSGCYRRTPTEGAE